MKHEPIRMCIVCRQMKPKRDMTRLVNVENNVMIDATGKLNGRGCYICDDLNCINKLKKQKTLNKVFKTNISDDTYINICEELVGKTTNN